MTAEWMLTDEEIEDIENEYPRQYGIGITATKAQAKKLLEYLIARCQVTYQKGLLPPAVFPQDLQELLIELEGK